jgi:hypothetical protein
MNYKTRPTPVPFIFLRASLILFVLFFLLQSITVAITNRLILYLSNSRFIQPGMNQWISLIFLTYIKFILLERSRGRTVEYFNLQKHKIIIFFYTTK